ncbi:hypothetical protein B0H14DRAFT_3142334 [Mycena olivaceomarginata]|nr:hypothetical protein B0H14DRAFT_3142334 [Mycena olivaceomarginata]
MGSSTNRIIGRKEGRNTQIRLDIARDGFDEGGGVGGVGGEDLVADVECEEVVVFGEGVDYTQWFFWTCRAIVFWRGSTGRTETRRSFPLLILGWPAACPFSFFPWYADMPTDSRLPVTTTEAWSQKAMSWWEARCLGTSRQSSDVPYWESVRVKPVTTCHAALLPYAPPCHSSRSKHGPHVLNIAKPLFDRAGLAISIVDHSKLRQPSSRITPKPLKRQFFPALFSQNKAPINLEEIKKFREITDKHQAILFNADPSVAGLRNETDVLTTELLNWGSDTMHLSEDDDGHEALLWALQAYIGLIAPWSAVRLKVLPLGIAAELGFSVVAQCAFSTGEYIYELIGLLTTDYVEGHTELSTITCPHHQTRHVFWGPIRMVNHDCSPNIQYVEVPGRRAMVASALRDIQIGDELVCDYGKDFWGGVCPCKTCQMPNGSTPLPAQQTSIPVFPLFQPQKKNNWSCNGRRPRSV